MCGSLCGVCGVQRVVWCVWPGETDRQAAFRTWCDVCVAGVWSPEWSACAV